MAIKPPMLKPGNTIGIVTPGSPLNSNTINAGIQTLESLGFNVILGDFVYTQDGFLAGTDEQRASDLMNMFSSAQVDMILPSRGGVGVKGILPYLDYSIIENNPKIISGYSDITVLLNTLTQFSNLITFNSLLLLDFTEGTPAYNYNQFFAATSTIAAPRKIQNPPGIPQISKVPGNVTGQIVGGNLTSFIGTLGTPYDIDTTDKIIFLEETSDPINTVYRHLNSLKLAGKFDDCIGIVMGECTACTPAYGVSYDQLINEFLVPLGKPLLSNVATAHGFYKATIPIGATVNLDSTNRTLTVLEPTVE